MTSRNHFFALVLSIAGPWFRDRGDMSTTGSHRVRRHVGNKKIEMTRVERQPSLDLALKYNVQFFAIHNDGITPFAKDVIFRTERIDRVFSGQVTLWQNGRPVTMNLDQAPGLILGGFIMQPGTKEVPHPLARSFSEVVVLNDGSVFELASALELVVTDSSEA